MWKIIQYKNINDFNQKDWKGFEITKILFENGNMIVEGKFDEILE